MEREKWEKGQVNYLDLGKKVDPDPFGFQTAGFLDPHTKVLHVCIDDILHSSATWKQRKRQVVWVFQNFTQQTITFSRLQVSKLWLVPYVAPVLLVQFLHKPSVVGRKHMVFQTRLLSLMQSELFNVNILHKLDVIFERLPNCFFVKCGGCRGFGWHQYLLGGVQSKL